jgi:hypothetical protein
MLLEGVAQRDPVAIEIRLWLALFGELCSDLLGSERRGVAALEPLASGAKTVWPEPLTAMLQLMMFAGAVKGVLNDLSTVTHRCLRK